MTSVSRGTGVLFPPTVDIASPVVPGVTNRFSPQAAHRFPPDSSQPYGTIAPQAASAKVDPDNKLSPALRQQPGLVTKSPGGVSMKLDPTRYLRGLKPRQTTYKGVEMRSRTEAHFAAWLDRNQATWTYEPRAYGAEAGQYLPDFQLEDVEILGSLRRVFVEVKPVASEVSMKLMDRVKPIWDSEPDAFVVAEVPSMDPVVFFPPDLYAMPMRMAWHRSAAGKLALAPRVERWGAA